MTLKQKFRAFNGLLDLKRIMPGYITVWIFRVMIILIFISHGAAFILNNNKLLQYENYCPEDAEEPCANAWINCTGNEYQTHSSVRCAPHLNEEMCDRMQCEDKYLQPGEGHRLHPFVKMVNGLSILLFVLAFVLNHLVYMMKTGNWRYKHDN